MVVAGGYLQTKIKRATACGSPVRSCCVIRESSVSLLLATTTIRHPSPDQADYRPDGDGGGFEDRMTPYDFFSFGQQKRWEAFPYEIRKETAFGNPTSNGSPLLNLREGERSPFLCTCTAKFCRTENHRAFIVTMSYSEVVAPVVAVLADKCQLPM